MMPLPPRFRARWLVLLAGCGHAPATSDASEDSDAETDTETDADTDSDTDADSSQPVDTAPDCAPAVEIGAGDIAWVPLAARDEVVMVHGPQGGWHILWSARVAGLQPTLQLRGVIADVASGVVVSDVTYNVASTPLDVCTGESVGQYGYLDVSGLADGSLDTPPELLGGHTMALRVEASDFLGGTAAAELEVVATPDPTDVD
jgi:hypothetical protein